MYFFFEPQTMSAYLNLFYFLSKIKLWTVHETLDMTIWNTSNWIWIMHSSPSMQHMYVFSNINYRYIKWWLKYLLCYHELDL